jgi:hypothetical protein
MRRNSDEYLRSLERRVRSGHDPAAVVELARLYERLGQGSGETDLDLARGVLRDAYWRDVREVGARVAEHGEDVVLDIDKSLLARRHVRPFPPTQILERQGGWIDLPEWLGETIAKSGRLARSGPIRDVIEFSFRGNWRDSADISATAERSFMNDVVSEARRILEDFPHPLGTRLRNIRILSIGTDEERPNFEAPTGSFMTLVAFFPHEGTFTLFFRMDDYWADWGDTIDFEFISVEDFESDFEVIA